MCPENFHKYSKIATVMDRLEQQSRLERSGQASVADDELMLAVTKDTGKFLSVLLTSMGASKVLEVGTSTGYSTLWFALALLQTEKNTLSQKAKKCIITIEKDPSKADRARKNFADAEVHDFIKIMEGNALDALSHLSNNDHHDTTLNGRRDGNGDGNGDGDLFDFVFLDADKENLTRYFDLALPLLRKGGLIVTDNMLYPEEYRPTMSQYVKYIEGNEHVTTVTVPIGYGEELTLKVK
jgi:predicted O-methyltransferase YrrM